MPRRLARDEGGDVKTEFREFLTGILSDAEMAQADHYLAKMAGEDEPAGAQDRRLRMSHDSAALAARVRRGALLSASEASQGFDAAFPMASHIRIS